MTTKGVTQVPLCFDQTKLPAAVASDLLLTSKGTAEALIVQETTSTVACLVLSQFALMANIRQIVISKNPAAGCLYTHLNTRLTQQLNSFEFFLLFLVSWVIISNAALLPWTWCRINLLPWCLLKTEEKVENLEWIHLQFCICFSSQAAGTFAEILTCINSPTFSWSSGG